MVARRHFRRRDHVLEAVPTYDVEKAGEPAHLNGEKDLNEGGENVAHAGLLQRLKREKVIV